LGNLEFTTAERIAAALEELDLEVKRAIGVTGVIGVLDTGRPGPTVALRADMDGLPVAEPTDSGNAVISQSPGVMHACGHDIHMSVALGAARVLHEFKSELRGKIVFIFQPAEEGIPSREKIALQAETGSSKVGADRLVNIDHVLDTYNIDAIFGLHGFPDTPAGRIGLMPEYALASSDSFEIELRGRSAHAGVSPWTGSDVLHIAAGIVLDLHALPARQTDPRRPKVVSVSMLDCTDGRTNILCHTAKLSGTVRTYAAEDKREIRERMNYILDAAVKARDPEAGECRRSGPKADLCWKVVTYDNYGPPVHQNSELLGWSGEVLRTSLGRDAVLEVPASLGAEDFAYYCERVPCAFFALGTGPPEGTGGLHTPYYAPSEDSIPVGVNALSALAISYLTEQ
jgi:amidohydrolase